MRSKKLWAGILAGLVLTAVAALAAQQEMWWVAAAALGVLLTADLFVSLDTNRRLRYLRPWMRKNLSTAARGRVQPTKTPRASGGKAVAVNSGGSAPTPTRVATEDLTGALRLMQAQLVGRLDRAQASLEDATQELREARAAHDLRDARDDG
ncbi:hypothetical protein BJF82_10100 [Kytococcus sp. CUA-901]|nr:hypothetical protein BJF82_10100 [Kytococcus sp. CUA-901]